MATHSSIFCLENPRDGGAWRTAVCGVAQSQTRLKRLSSSSVKDAHSMHKTETEGECVHTHTHTHTHNADRCVGFSLQVSGHRDLLQGEELKSLLMKVKSAAAAAKSLQLCPNLCDPTDGSPPGSPIPGILQARTLEWVAISFSKA